MGAGPLSTSAPLTARSPQGASSDPLGYVVALTIEGRTLAITQAGVDQLIDCSDGLVLIGGMGAERASRAAERLIAAGARALISYGTCAGLDPLLQSGDLILPANVIGTRQRFATEHPWRTRLRDRLSTALRVHEMDLAHVHQPLHTKTQKRTLAASCGAAAADMESLAVAECAQRHGRPFIAVRVVLDCANTSMPSWISVATDEYGHPRPAHLLRAAVRDPLGASSLLPLALRSRRALATLRQVRALAGLGLCAAQS